jgi:hypothetical protein
MAEVTQQSLNALLQKATIREHVIGRALVVLLNRQTAGEASSNTTNIVNGVGFTQADAHSGCLTAKYYIKHNRLADWQIARWMKPAKNGTARIVKYWRQLNEAAQVKASHI